MFNVLIETGNRDPREVRCLHRECGIGRGDGNLVVLQGWNIGSRHAALRLMRSLQQPEAGDANEGFMPELVVR